MQSKPVRISCSTTELQSDSFILLWFMAWAPTILNAQSSMYFDWCRVPILLEIRLQHDLRKTILAAKKQAEFPFRSTERRTVSRMLMSCSPIFPHTFGRSTDPGPGPQDGGSHQVRHARLMAKFLALLQCASRPAHSGEGLQLQVLNLELILRFSLRNV
ncbi:hypothetical protein PENSPDRAFT_753749 [Peniophora sp. CONT]|nr:hypothetical protein PENSPDRAFT_753749 [Peniophora sp. CONT]